MPLTSPHVRRCTRPAVAPIALTVGPTADTLRLAGDLDVASAARLTDVLLRHGGSGRPLVVDLAGVRFADSHGLSPVLDAAARRQGLGAPTVRLTGVGPPVARVLTALGVAWSPVLDLTGWPAPDPCGGV